MTHKDRALIAFVYNISNKNETRYSPASSADGSRLSDEEESVSESGSRGAGASNLQSRSWFSQLYREPEEAGGIGRLSEEQLELNFAPDTNSELYFLTSIRDHYPQPTSN